MCILSASCCPSMPDVNKASWLRFCSLFCVGHRKKSKGEVKQEEGLASSYFWCICISRCLVIYQHCAPVVHHFSLLDYLCLQCPSPALSAPFFSFSSYPFAVVHPFRQAYRFTHVLLHCDMMYHVLIRRSYGNVVPLWPPLPNVNSCISVVVLHLQVPQYLLVVMGNPFSDHVVLFLLFLSPSSISFLLVTWGDTSSYLTPCL